MTSLGRRKSAGMSAVEKGVVIAATALAASAVVNAYLASKAEDENQPIGKFVDVDGVRLHYTEKGTGNPVVFLHGNGSMIQDFSSSGLLDITAQSFRVFAFDRPGFGFSVRPSNRKWTPAAQARLFQRAFAQLSIVNPVVVAHSWGTLVALRLAVDFPTVAKQLILLSGYYFPTQRADTLISTPGSLPMIGPMIQHTVGPIVGRLFAKSAIETMFNPLPVSACFEKCYAIEMAMRPSQLSAVAEETAMMPGAVETIEEHYKLISISVQIFAGDMDQVVDTTAQSVRLHDCLSNSQLHVEAGVGHMIHHAIPGKIAAAVAA